MSALPEKKIKLTKRAVDTTSIDPNRRVEIWDTAIQGFNVRIYPTGRKVYYLQYRNEYKRTRKIKIGIHGNISTEQARETAQTLSLKISAGEDPAEQTVSKKRLPTVAELCRQYLDLYAQINKRPKSIVNDRSMINSVIFPKLGSKRLKEVTVRDLQKVHKSLRETPYKANRVRSLLCKMFSLAIEWKWHTENPAKSVSKYQEQKRTRWLKEEEIDRLWDTLDHYPNPAVAMAIKMLLLTGARKNEVISATWDQIDFERKVWTKPAHTTKQKREEFLPLSTIMIKLLEDWKMQSTSKFLFPGKVERQPLKDLKRAWSSVRKLADLEEVRIHDLRHTYASHLVSSGLSLSIVGKLLGHTQASTTQRYAHLADAPLREATELLGNKIRR